MYGRISLKNHLIALGLAFVCCTLLAFTYTSFYYEARARSIKSAEKELALKKAELEAQNGAARKQGELEGKNAFAKKQGEVEKENQEGAEETSASWEGAPPQIQKSKFNNTWIMHLPMSLIYWWPWVALTPIILLLCQWIRFRRRSWHVALPLHLAASLIIGAAKTLVEAACMRGILNEDNVIVGVGTVTISCSTYWCYMAAYNGFVYYRAYRDREMRTAHLERRLAQAQLQVLKMQLQPHFLFNTLHAITSLMHSDINAADRMVSRLSEYLRLTLKNVDQQEVSLRQELDFLKRYLEIEQIRFSDRLRVEMDIARETLGAQMPNLMLQPLVENAVQNGVGRSAAPGAIVIRARESEASLCIEIRDSGPRLLEGDLSEGMHERMDSTQARLNQLYGPAGRLEFSTPREGGSVVKLFIPIHGDTSENPID